ncbi:5'-methylthioadenosine/adenosylhomocysteine nucleosidase [Paenibacillus sp. YN15]|uniref:5'-methylthioadenosine/adenosylhomocysteine nucleosidase n=1 Tax=Paenibacillus sp. YN15 TaxID=1742774 RepID=UPI000DCD7B5A|nr:5'-methylthioadenosine/adenosylhomocysteine nucleosidase [Paenibacillus sp. YN15]RAV04548.1 5'-methylthioadenosine/adenosylhomocysteine nucleosidase [Paenibacillus sp. YN15]
MGEAGLGKYGVIGIIGAMDEEVRLLAGKLEEREEIQAAGIRFMKGKIAGRRVVLCKSGVGKVNAAVTAQLLVTVCGAEAVLFTGVAGALDPELEVGDLVVSLDCLQHDMDASALGFPRGVIPFQEQSVFTADPELVRLAAASGQELLPGRVRTGRVLSGDRFIADKEEVAALRRDFGGVCAEMEGAAVAQVCGMNDIPFVIIRSMSDKADGSAPVSFAEFTALVAQCSCRLVEHMLGKL